MYARWRALLYRVRRSDVALARSGTNPAYTARHPPCTQYSLFSIRRCDFFTVVLTTGATVRLSRIFYRHRAPRKKREQRFLCDVSSSTATETVRVRPEFTPPPPRPVHPTRAADQARSCRLWCVTLTHRGMKLTRNCLGNIGKMLDFYSQFNPSPLSIKQFIDFGKSSPILGPTLFVRDIKGQRRPVQRVTFRHVT